MKYNNVYFDHRLTFSTAPSRRLQRYMFAAVIIAISVLVVHQFADDSESLGSLIWHAIVVAGAYTTAFIIVDILWFRRNKTHLQRHVTVGRIWLVSLLILITGYLILAPVSSSEHFLKLHTNQAMRGAFTPLLKILPIWALLTAMAIYFGINQQIHRKLQLLLSSKTRQSPDTPVQDNPGTVAAHLTLPIDGGKSWISIEFEQIVYIQVVEHYCHIFLHSMASPFIFHTSLKQLARQLPMENFLRVHRSYLVNLMHVKDIKRHGRDYKIHLDVAAPVLPISRSRVMEVRRKFEITMSSIRQ